MGTLERRNPGAVPPANRLASARSANAFGPMPAASSAMVRAHMQKRRRDIFVGLASLTGGTLLVGIVPQLRLLWIVSLLSGAVLAGYCYMLVQLRTLAVERDMQVGFSGNHNRVASPSAPGVPRSRPVSRKRQIEEEELAYAYSGESPLLRRSAS
ncbi:MAG: hypothetical protein WKF86_01435 [Acidimicrobiales bacterium]